jgi:hypothetical protein
LIEIIIQPTGDRAEADDWASARAAARTMMREARQELGCRPTASYVVDGVLAPEGAVAVFVNEAKTQSRIILQEEVS